MLSALSMYTKINTGSSIRHVYWQQNIMFKRLQLLSYCTQYNFSHKISYDYNKSFTLKTYLMCAK